MDPSTLALLLSIKESAIGVWVRDGVWTWPALETLHFAGLCFLLGGVAVADLRLLGLMKSIPYSTAASLLKLAVLGFGINLITGALFFFGDPERYYVNVSFRVKMFLIVLAGLNLLLYGFKVRPASGGWGAGAAASGVGKAVGLASLLIWLGVIAMGRMIPFWE